MTIRYLASEGEKIATLARRPSALDAFRAYVGARLASFDLPAPVLLRELRTRGDTGGLTILRDGIRYRVARIQVT